MFPTSKFQEKIGAMMTKTQLRHIVHNIPSYGGGQDGHQKQKGKHRPQNLPFKCTFDRFKTTKLKLLCVFTGRCFHHVNEAWRISHFHQVSSETDRNETDPKEGHKKPSLPGCTRNSETHNLFWWHHDTFAAGVKARFEPDSVLLLNLDE